MPRLDNPKHEMFASCMARGMSAAQAFKEAGYSSKGNNALRLKNNEAIQLRIEELQAIVIDKSVAAATVDKAWVLRGLKEIVDRCLQRTAVLRKGRIIHYQFDPQAAARAMELLGRELGMFTERVEQDTTIRVIAAQPVSEEDWEARYAAQSLLIEGGRANGNGAGNGGEQGESAGSAGSNGHRAPVRDDDGDDG